MGLFYLNDFAYELRFAGFYHKNKALLVYKWTTNKSGNELKSYNFLNWFCHNKIKWNYYHASNQLARLNKFTSKKHLIFCSLIFRKSSVFFLFFTNDNIYWCQLENNKLKWLKWNKNTWNWYRKHLHTLYTEQNLHIWKTIELKIKVNAFKKHPIPCKSFDKKFDKNSKLVGRYTEMSDIISG